MKEEKVFFAELLTIGDELLKGSTLNTNAKFLGKELTDLGFRTQAHVSCPDIISIIKEKIGEALGRSDLIILSGGLGPTPDDLTRDAVAEYFSSPLIFSKSQFAQIKKLYRRYGTKIPQMVRKEAMFPKNSLPLINRVGVALGFSIETQGRLIVVLPGVPSELQKMYFAEVLPLIRKFFSKLKTRYSLIVKTVGLSEPDVMLRLQKDFFDDEFDFGIYPHAGEVTLRLYASERETIHRLKAKACERLKNDIYSLEDISLAEAIGRILIRKRKTLAIAESCSGGMLAQELTQVSGASKYFVGGVIAYSNALKQKFLGVPEEVLQYDGAVSEPAAFFMATGARKNLKTDYALSITGVAGPTGGSKQKPVGRVYLGLADSKEVQVIERDFWGDRLQVQTKSVKKALELLWRKIK